MKPKKIKEWASVFIAKNPRRAILLIILTFNIFFFLFAALVISILSRQTNPSAGFWESVFFTITMILDAGCIQFVVDDIGKVGVGLVIFCLCTVVLGMISFTGAVIGYVTNYISGFIEKSNSGARRLKISDHTVILNWNSRASEIINDLLYSGHEEKIVILSEKDTEEIEKEINERISDTLSKESIALRKACEKMSFFARKAYKHKNRLKDNLTIIVRQGDTFSAKQLADISLKYAKTVIVLGADIQNSVCKFDYRERLESHERGNSNTVKTLIQVSEITAAYDSADKQKIIVEAEDDWTLSQINNIIKHKEKLGKCNIVPVSINKVLGQILSQFSIMPELNQVYSELFSNKGAEFMCVETEKMPSDESKQMEAYLADHFCAIPITTMTTKVGVYDFFVANSEQDIEKTGSCTSAAIDIDVNEDYSFKHKNVIILGHNSNSTAIMNGFDSFRNEWNRDDGEEVLNIIVIDDKKSLEKHSFYESYPYVKRCVIADIYDRDIICETVKSFVAENDDDTSVLILSDDTVPAEDLDASALTYLIYIQDIISDLKKSDSDFDLTCIDVIVEILNPKNYDVVHNYSVNNVVISNRYISKMVTQIGEKDALYEFYNDILSYDESGKTDGTYESQELYVKKVRDFFTDGKIPPECTAAQLIRGVFDSVRKSSAGKNKALVIGYVDRDEGVTLFMGEQNSIKVKLQENDKVIVFTYH